MSIEDLKEDIHKANERNLAIKTSTRQNMSAKILKEFKNYKRAIRGNDKNFDVVRSNEEFHKKHNPFKNAFGEKTPDQLIREAVEKR